MKWHSALSMWECIQHCEHGFAAGVETQEQAPDRTSGGWGYHSFSLC